MSSDLQLKYFLSNPKTDWTTSTAVAHSMPHEYSMRSQALNQFARIAHRPGYIPLMRMPHAWRVDEDFPMKLRKHQLTSTTKSEYVPKYKYREDNIQCSAPSCERIQYVKTFLEYPNRMLLPIQKKSSGSHYQQEFSAKVADLSKPWEYIGLMDVKKYSAARPSSDPTFSIEDGGAAVHLDPYATSSRLVHRPFSHYERTGILYDKSVGSFHDTYEVEKMPGDKRNILPNIAIRLYPIYDSQVFRSKATIRVLPKATHAVPHKGLLSEFQEQYRLH